MPVIDLEKRDPEFKKLIQREFGAVNITSCYTCLTCVISCPVAQANDAFNPLDLMRRALLGLKQDVLENDTLWLCSGCYACQERCPMGVRITDILNLLKNMAVEAGRAPAGIRAQMDLIVNNGRIYPLDDFDNKKRGKIDLPPIPTSCEVVKELFNES
jgi:heterodisulfide reductase subunit C